QTFCSGFLKLLHIHSATDWSCATAHEPGISGVPRVARPVHGSCGAGGIRLWSGASVEGFDLETQGHVFASLGGLPAQHVAVAGAGFLTDTAQGYPFAQATADACVGGLHVDNARAVIIHPVALAADGDMHQLAAEARRHVEAASHVAILSVSVNLAVRAGTGGGQRYALADLDQRRVALGGLYLLGSAATAVGATADDAYLVASVDFATADLHLGIAGAEGAIDAIAAVVLVVAVGAFHGDQQTARAGVQLLQLRGNFTDPVRRSTDDQ